MRWAGHVADTYGKYGTKYKRLNFGLTT